MSQLAQKYVMGLDRMRVSRRQKFFLLVLACHHQAMRETYWPSHASLAAELLCDDREIRRLTAECAHLGILHFIPGKGSGKPGEYVFLDLPTQGVSALSECPTQGETQGATQGGTQGLFTRRNKELQDTNTNTKAETHPNPPLQGGNNFHLRPRDHQRIAHWLDKATTPSESTIGSSYANGRGWPELVRSACDFCLLSYDSAIHDLLVMDRDLWEPRLGLKKEPQRAAG